MGLRDKGLVILLLFVSELLAVTSEELKTVIGIDLGTTCSCVGVYRNGRVEIIANDKGNRTTPTWVAFTDTEHLIGEAAKDQASLNPEHTIFDVKRLIGRKFDDPEVQKDMKLLPYKIVNKEGKPYIEMKIKDEEIKLFSPEEISAMILGKMIETAETYLGKKIKDVVLTVPAYFNDPQMLATRDAGAIAGLNVDRIITEPVAAAISYGLNKKGEGKNILVYALGGGTFDVTILTIDNGVLEVLSTSGDTHLGGEDLDHRVMDYFIKLIRKKYNQDISENNKALGKLRRECERAKRALSFQHQVQVEIKSLFDGVDFSEPLTRARFEDLNMDLFKKTMGPVEMALKGAFLEKSDIGEIVLVGGSTRIPKVQQLLKDYFDGKEMCKDINPEEVVAFGAASVGGIFSREWKGNNDIFDINPWRVEIPLGLGIETAGGVMTRLIPKVTVNPIENSKTFTTYQDQQTTVSIKVYEGIMHLTKYCSKLGQFDLSGIPPAPRGVPQIEVTFQVDVNGTLHVTAEDKASKNKQSTTITNDKSREMVKRMFIEAEDFAEDDKEARERIDARNKFEIDVYNPETKANLWTKLDWTIERRLRSP